MIPALLLSGLGVLVAAGTPPAAFLEAEAATLGGTARAARCAPCSGGRLVGYIGHHPKSDVTFEVTVNRGGRYDLTVYYLLSGSRTFDVSVNGVPGTALELSASSWQRVHSAATVVSLTAGRNTLRFYNDTEYAPDLDRIALRRSRTR